MNKVEASKEWWTGLKSIICQNSKYANNKVNGFIQNNFDGDVPTFIKSINNFFVSVAKDIQPFNENIFDSRYAYVPDCFLPTVLDVENMLSGIKVTKSLGPDGIPN